MSDITQQSKLEFILDECPWAAGLLMQLGIDPSKHTQQSLMEICDQYSLDKHAMLEVILDPPVRMKESEPIDCSQAPLGELVDHIINHHHAYLRRLFIKLQLLISKVQHDRGDDYAALQKIAAIVGGFRSELESHLLKEEQIIFPQIHLLVQMSKNLKSPADSVDRAAKEISHDFEEEAHQISRLREVTDGFATSPTAPTAYNSLMEELCDLEADLERHNYLESEILFPRALELQVQLRPR